MKSVPANCDGELRRLLGPVGPICGQGLHTGRRCKVELFPAALGAGLCFVCEGAGERIPVRLGHVVVGARRTVLRRGAASVSTVEHLLAALAALGIWNAEVRIWGDEVPGLDGSAAPFVEALLQAAEIQSYPVRRWQVVRPYYHRRGAGTCQLTPAGALAVECSVDYSHPLIGRQTAALRGPFVAPTFVARFARARTFGCLGEEKALRARGLAKGASLGATLVFGDQRVLNPSGTRFWDEPVRHKIVDIMGDLCVLGGPLVGRVRQRFGGHRLLVETLQHAVRDSALVSDSPKM